MPPVDENRCEEWKRGTGREEENQKGEMNRIFTKHNNFQAQDAERMNLENDLFSLQENVYLIPWEGFIIL